MAKTIQKAEATNKRAQENASKEMKSRKEAYMNIEREKSSKYEQGRLQQIKEQAVRDTEPKLLHIIKSANEDIKKAEERMKEELDTFKSEHKVSLEKQLTEGKQRNFEEGEQEKEDLKADIERRNRERLDQKEADLEEELTRLKGQYSKRIKEQEARMQQEME